MQNKLISQIMIKNTFFNKIGGCPQICKGKSLKERKIEEKNNLDKVKEDELAKDKDKVIS